MAEKTEEDNGTRSEDIPMQEKSTSSEKDSSATSEKPPNPPKRDYAVENAETQQSGHDESASVKKRFKLGSFPSRPEFVYKPDSSEAGMSCIRNILVVINLFIWLLGAVITALGIWIKVDSEFLDIQTNLDMKQFTTASYVLIVVGVLVMLVGFLGCYGVIASKMFMLVIFCIIVGIVIVLEIAVMAIVWTATSNKNVQEDIKLKATEALHKMLSDPNKFYFVNLLQAKLKCCGVNSKKDYDPHPLPNTCYSRETGMPYDSGCYVSIMDYLKDKASVVGGIAVAILLLQLGLLGLTICFICGIKKTATNSIF